ncbi:MAG: flagellar basal body P-ring formation chaperone FlgA [Bryobacteraceae bacterium]
MQVLAILAFLPAAMAACLPVEGDRILMRHLSDAITAFASANPQRIVSLAPAPGATRIFRPPEIAALAKANGIAAEQLADSPFTVCFQRSRSPLTTAAILKAMHESRPADAEIEVTDFCRSDVPVGRLLFPRSGLAPPSSAGGQHVIWRGRLQFSATESIPVWAKVRVSVPRRHVVPREDLPAGKPIEATQIQVVDTGVHPGLPVGPAETEVVVGTTPRLRLRAGFSIPPGVLLAPLAVEKGASLFVEVRAGAAVVKLEVRAEASGRPGDLIPVRNAESGKRFRARVMEKGLARAEGI